jgi:histidyl-tRNA synthetase
MPAVGFGMGIERLLLTLDEKNITIAKPNLIDLYISSMDEVSKTEALKLCLSLRKKGIKCDCDHMGRSLKAQMKYSNKVASLYTIVIGENEVTNRCAKIKRMSDGEQFEVNLDNYKEILDIISQNN